MLSMPKIKYNKVLKIVRNSYKHVLRILTKIEKSFYDNEYTYKYRKNTNFNSPIVDLNKTIRGMEKWVDEINTIKKNLCK